MEKLPSSFSGRPCDLSVKPGVLATRSLPPGDTRAPGFVRLIDDVNAVWAVGGESASFEALHGDAMPHRVGGVLWRGELPDHVSAPPFVCARLELRSTSDRGREIYSCEELIMRIGRRCLRGGSRQK